MNKRFTVLRRALKCAAAGALALCIVAAGLPAAHASGQAAGDLAVRYASGNPIASDNPTVTKVTMNTSRLDFDDIGSSESLDVDVEGTNIDDIEIVWSSSDPGVASVDDEGEVTAEGNGTAIITVRAGSKSDTATVTVKQRSKKVVIKYNGKDPGPSLAVYIGKTYDLTASVLPKETHPDNKIVTWESSNKKIATVNEKGTVRIKKDGTVTIRVETADGQKDSIKLTAKKIVKAKSIKISGQKTMKRRKNQTLKVTVLPKNVSSKAVAWRSSDPKIATVDAKGKVFAKKTGSVTITATAKDGSKKSARFKITIKK